jgi:5'-deoxy-5'-methylthioadenosine phosphorylase
MLAIIGGSGLAKLAILKGASRELVRTPYGEASAPLMRGELMGKKVVFLARHGHGHTVAPHEVNYRANIWALAAQQATDVIAIASVGGIRSDLVPGTLVVPHQIMDYTFGRKSTFFEGPENPVTHIDFTEPYTEALRQLCLRAASRAGEVILERGVYAAVQGPRLETAAEINRLERDGADMVGMTAMPEAALAREIGLSYAAIAAVANFAAGRGTSPRAVRLDEVGTVLEAAMKRVRKILEALAENYGSETFP